MKTYLLLFVAAVMLAGCPGCPGAPGTPADSPTGGPGERCAGWPANPCDDAFYACIGGTCQPIGGLNQPCRGIDNACQAGLTCARDPGTGRNACMDCGGAGEACCPSLFGAFCNAGTMCNGGTCGVPSSSGPCVPGPNLFHVAIRETGTLCAVNVFPVSTNTRADAERCVLSNYPTGSVEVVPGATSFTLRDVAITSQTDSFPCTNTQWPAFSDADALQCAHTYCALGGCNFSSGRCSGT